jgi:hypothetical protein
MLQGHRQHLLLLLLLWLRLLLELDQAAVDCSQAKCRSVLQQAASSHYHPMHRTTPEPLHSALAVAPRLYQQQQKRCYSPAHPQQLLRQRQLHQLAAAKLRT